MCVRLSIVPEVTETRLPSPPPRIVRDVSPASGSGCRHVVGGSQDGNPGESATLTNGALSAPVGNKVDAGSVKEEPAVHPRWSLPLVVPSSDAPNPVSHRYGLGIANPVEFRMLGRQWISAEPVSHEFSAWYKPSVRRPSRSASVEVNPPSVGHTPECVSVDCSDREQSSDQFDCIFGSVLWHS